MYNHPHNKQNELLNLALLQNKMETSHARVYKREEVLSRFGAAFFLSSPSLLVVQNVKVLLLLALLLLRHGREVVV